MKKLRIYLGLLGILCCIFFLFLLYNHRNIQMQTNEEGLYLNIKADSARQTVLPWQDEDGIVYFFLPSLASNRIYFDGIKESVRINGTPVNKWTGFTWEPETAYTVEAAGITQQIIFVKSENIPALFLSTESGNMESIHADKEYQEPGTISVFTQDGHLQYAGGLDSISGRGNSTWNQEKKPYSIVLSKKASLCGLREGKSWKLLALFFEHDKIHSKLTYDMAQELGLSATPQCTWVDLYCNGEYQGLYLLTESKKRNLPSDAQWLLEKTHNSRLSEAEELVSFTTEMGYLFQTEKLQAGSLTEVTAVADYIQQIENLVANQDPSYKAYLDLDSLARKLLLEKIVMNYDAMGASSYFVLCADGKLYAGPAWDYDNSFGTSGFFSYRSPIEGAPDEMTGWFNVLYTDEEFYRAMIDAYQDLLPWLNTMLTEGIDSYAKTVQASQAMDQIRWGGMAQNQMYLYEDYDSYIRYLKYFLANRLNYLNEIWNIEGFDFPEPQATEEIHTVTFQAADGTLLDTWQIPDGTCMHDLPALDSSLYRGWYFTGIDKEYSSIFPVYSDLSLYAREKETDN